MNNFTARPFKNKVMMMYNIQLYILLSCLSLAGLYAQSPDWQWAKRGGGIQPLEGAPNAGLNSSRGERVLDLVIDSNDNYYFLAELSPSVSDYDGTPLQPMGTGNTKDILVFSTDCSGTLRWLKIFGGGFNDRAVGGIGLDASNNVYIGGTTANTGGIPPNFANDTIKASPAPPGVLDASKKNIFIIKYDDQGVFQWFREPEGPLSNTFGGLSLGMVVEPNGRTHTLIRFAPGTHLDGQLTVTNPSGEFAIVIYDASGVLENFITVNMVAGSRLYDYLFAYDASLQRYYIGDSKTQSSDNISINGFGASSDQGYYLAALDNQGQVLWYHENTLAVADQLGDIALDANGDIYFTGYYLQQVTTNPPITDSFAGFNFVGDPNATTQVRSPFLLKLDSSGNLLWGTNALFFSGFPGQSIALKGNDLYLGLGSLFNEWDMLPFGNEVPGAGTLATDNAVLRFNKTTGSVEEVIDMPGTGYDKIMALGIDSNDNVVVGGHLGSSLLDGHPVGTLFKAGGNTDFFIAQHGSGNCSTLSIHEPGAASSIKLYPQPAREWLYLQSENPLNNYTIYNLQGQRIQGGAVQDHALDTSQLSPGVYILQITDSEQRKQSFKLVVE